MTPKKLKEMILPTEGQHILIRAVLPNTPTPIAHVFATRFYNQTRPVVWVTQLVVHPSHRSQGTAKALLHALPKEEVEKIGALSSSPFAIAAVLRAFGRGIEHVEDVSGWTGVSAQEVMASCPVQYVRDAKVRGTLFESPCEQKDGSTEGAVSCADTGFWIDHSEPEKALKILEEKGVKWRLGSLPEGCEFLVLVEVRHR